VESKVQPESAGQPRLHDTGLLEEISMAESAIFQRLQPICACVRSAILLCRAAASLRSNPDPLVYMAIHEKSRIKIRLKIK
jgi:hypothetical protein